MRGKSKNKGIEVGRNKISQSNFVYRSDESIISIPPKHTYLWQIINDTKGLLMNNNLRY